MILENKKAIVTGGGAGIGKAIVLELAREGADVAVCDINFETAEKAAKEVETLGRKAVPIKMDVSNMEEVNSGIQKAIEEFGKVDVLVNNAGWDKVEPFVKSQPETWEKVISINLKGNIYCTKAVLDNMIENGSGRIINMASDAGRNGSSGEAVYSACKGGIIAFTKSIARETARKGIRVNTVCPGPTDTPLLQGIAEENPKLVKALEKAIPVGRLGKPEDLAPMVAFLASDGAEFITGQTVSVSGGLGM